MYSIDVILEKSMPITQLIISVVALYVAWKTIKLTEKLTIESKRADVTMECNKRYDELWSLWEYYLRNPSENPYRYYHRFWSLQKDEYDYFTQNFISEDVFRYWMQSRYEEWRIDAVLNNLSYQQGWNEVCKNWARGPFNDFMDLVFKNKIDEALLKEKLKTRKKKN